MAQSYKKNNTQPNKFFTNSIVDYRICKEPNKNTKKKVKLSIAYFRQVRNFESSQHHKKLPSHHTTYVIQGE